MSRPEIKSPVSNRALEMIMRDVLDGMEEISLHAAYAAELEASTDFSLLPPAPERPENNIIYFPQPLRRIA
ncbi:MAG: hypothetical protein H7842_05550 [Gammaproteobacteria bacterium SHHR-1]|uniref:hypothetical protein n=1 Tax=Magnetovirga frankeli TaxID=947516 RepID=UPI001293BE57|nr:hypothetical protein D5125_05240 [gamma proteobacterium SS-5]